MLQATCSAMPASQAHRQVMFAAKARGIRNASTTAVCIWHEHQQIQNAGWLAHSGRLVVTRWYMIKHAAAKVAAVHGGGLSTSHLFKWSRANAAEVPTPTGWHAAACSLGAQSQHPDVGVLAAALH